CPLYKEVPKSIRFEYYEITAQILRYINQMATIEDLTLTENIFIIWHMINKIILRKLNRGGPRANSELYQRIKNIKNGRLLVEWDKFVLASMDNNMIHNKKDKINNI